jgi:hypothetical protein
LDFVLDIPNVPPVAPDVAAPFNLVLDFADPPPSPPPPPIGPAALAPLNLVLEFPNPSPVAAPVAGPLNLVLQFPNPAPVPVPAPAPCYIRNTASDSDGFRTEFWQRAQPLSTFHFLSISNILLRSLTVAYSQPSVIAPIPAYCNRGLRRGTPS